MKDNSSIRKVIYIGNNYVALVLFNKLDNENNILFANQLPSSKVDHRVKLNCLLTDAANFTGFNIKDAELVFDDPEVLKVSYCDQEFIDCYNEQDITKEIYKKAGLDNYYVNEINWSKIEYDDVDKKAIVNCEICVSDYITYIQYIKTVNSCGIEVTNSTNLYSLLNSNKVNAELVLNIVNGDIYASKHFDGRLGDITKLNCNYSTIKAQLAKRFNCNLDKINSMAALANSINNVDDYDINLSLSYNAHSKSISTIKNNDFVNAYRKELANQINEIIRFSAFKKVRVVSSSELDNIENCDFAYNNETIGLETIAPSLVVSLNNLDVNANKMTHFSFENKISVKFNKIETLLA